MQQRYFRIDESQLLIDSIERVWRKGHIYARNPAVMEHLLLKTPYRADFAGAGNYTMLGIWTDEGEVVGLHGLIPQRLNFLGKEYLSVGTTIWKVAAGSGANGLSLMDYLNSDKPGMALGLAESETAHRLHRAMNCIMIEAIPRYVCVTRVKETLENVLDGETPAEILPVEIRRGGGAGALAGSAGSLAGFAESLAGGAAAMSRGELTMGAEGVNARGKLTAELEGVNAQGALMEGLEGGNMLLSYTVTDSFDAEEWDEFYHSRFAPIMIGTARDSVFLKWRYQESPVLTYHFLTVKDKAGSLEGLAVYRIEEILDGRFKIGRILEFISLDEGAAIALARALLDSDREVLFWDFYCQSDITAFGLEAVGFRKIPEWSEKLKFPTRFHPLDYEEIHMSASIYVDKDIRKKLNPVKGSEWYLTKGDCDIDRAN